MQRKLIFCDPEKCVGCQLCEFACSLHKEGSINPLLSRIRLVRIEPFAMMAIACQVCEDPPCVRSCPRTALRANEETGLIIIDEDKCDGCGWCIQACEFGAIMVHPDKRVAVTCDLCGPNSEPKCIEFCPTKALKLVTTEEIGQKMRRKAFTKIIAETS